MATNVNRADGEPFRTRRRFARRLFALAAVVLLAYVLSPPRLRRSETVRDPLTTNFKQTGIGLNDYADHAPDLAFPRADWWPKPGPNPLPEAERLSWRVSILPHIEMEDVFRAMDPAAGSGAPPNAAAATKRIAWYSYPGDRDPATAFRVFVGLSTLFDPTRPRGYTLAEIADGTSNTILVAEAADRVPWPHYRELPFAPGGPLPALGLPTRDRFLVACADGSVKSVLKSAAPETLRAAITAAGNETITPFD